MGIEKEIERAVKRIAALDTKSEKSSAELDRIISMVKTSMETSAFDFGKTTSLVLNQKGKKRRVKQYEDLYSAESVLCQCIKQILDRVFKVKYPNRNKTIKELFSVLAATVQMSDFTIVKFDFKDYFNSISSVYVFEKYLKSNLVDRREIDLRQYRIIRQNRLARKFCALMRRNCTAILDALQAIATKSGRKIAAKRRRCNCAVLP